MLIDLQFHSTYSDGYLTPTELAKFVAKQGVKIAALTDHNTVGGLDEFRQACRQYRIKPITGIELYVKLNGKRFNILWFNFNDANPELHNILRSSQIRRRNRMRNILLKLESNGFKINVEKILGKYTHYTPINQIIDDIWSTPNNRAKIKKELSNKNPMEGEIIHEYFRNPEISILRESYINIGQILNLRKKIGGQIILCHPAKYAYIKKDNWKNFKKIGIDGVEILSPHHSIGAVMFAQHLAREFNFIATGGSDFHRHERGSVKIKNCYDYFKVDSKYLRGVDKIIK
ncbi:MAG: PHP domain-containing protein [Patescibacteria group bacterium]|nr:PHP domain-containing protein [Patescibacteria group bacterium]